MIKILFFLLGRIRSYRVGRALYMEARGDCSTEVVLLGELMVQHCIIKAALKRGVNHLYCFDIGANIGDWSKPMLLECEKMGVELDLYLFEPVPSTHKILRKNIGVRSNIYYESIALSSGKGSTEMYLVGDCAGTNSLHKDHSNMQKDVISVATMSIEEYLLTKDIEYVDLIKIDTEGHDAEVIAGALQVLKEGKVSVIQFEYNFRWVFSRCFLKDIFDLIDNTDYRLGKVCSDHIELYTAWHPEMERYFEANYLLIKKDAIGWFKIHECTVDTYNTLTVG